MKSQARSTRGSGKPSNRAISPQRMFPARRICSRNMTHLLDVSVGFFMASPARCLAGVDSSPRVAKTMPIQPGALTSPIIHAAREVAEGKHDDQFPIDVYQTGSGTSSNMNANEVISNRAIEFNNGDRFAAQKTIHPNDHVNLGQSTNDMFPTAIHVAVGQAISKELLPALKRFQAVLDAKAKQWDHIIKIGRTHLADATPIRLGQEFSGYARQIELSIERIGAAASGLEELALGGTAVGTGINTHPEFPSRTIKKISQMTELPFREAKNHFEAQAAKDAVVQVSGSLKTLAVSLTKIANDLRWLSSGPRCGIGEIELPDTQPGSSIMPGKVNPVMCESVLQVAAHVIGCDATITVCGQAGNFELNVMMPIMALRLLEAITFSASVVKAFTEKCIVGIEANKEHCEEMIEQSRDMVTALAPVIGSDAAAKLGKEPFATGKTVREVALAHEVLPPDKLAKILDPWRMTEPGIPDKE